MVAAVEYTWFNSLGNDFPTPNDYHWSFEWLYLHCLGVKSLLPQKSLFTLINIKSIVLHWFWSLFQWGKADPSIAACLVILKSTHDHNIQYIIYLSVVLVVLLNVVNFRLFETTITYTPRVKLGVVESNGEFFLGRLIIVKLWG